MFINTSAGPCASRQWNIFMSVQIQSGVVETRGERTPLSTEKFSTVACENYYVTKRSWCPRSGKHSPHTERHRTLHRTLCCLHDRAYINPGCTPDHVLYLNIPIPFRGITLVVQLRPQIELHRRPKPLVVSWEIAAAVPLRSLLRPRLS